MSSIDWMAIVVGCLAVGFDLRYRRIPNWLSLAGLAGALLLHGTRHGLAGLWAALAGALVGFALFLVFYLVGGMGGGDLKLMAVFGALLGPSGIVVAAVFAAILGGLLAAAILLRHSATRAIPYAPAIVGGCWLLLWASR